MVIPFFKNTFYLKETLVSLQKQSDENWTAVVLDDSVDFNESAGASAVVADLKESRIRYQKNPANLGLARNWNQGIDLAQDAELLVILHADDCLKEDYIKEMRALAARHPEATGYFCKPEVIGANGEPVFSLADWYKVKLTAGQKEVVLAGMDGAVRLIPGDFVFCPTLCYRVKKLGCDRFRNDLRMVLDFELLLRVLYAGGSWVGYYERALFQYRRHGNNTTLTLNKDLTRFHEESSMYVILSRKLAAVGDAVNSKRARKMRVVLLNLGFQMAKSLVRLDLYSFRSESRLFLELLAS